MANGPSVVWKEERYTASAANQEPSKAAGLAPSFSAMVGPNGTIKDYGAENICIKQKVGRKFNKLKGTCDAIVKGMM